jgi:hypothetical protein
MARRRGSTRIITRPIAQSSESKFGYVRFQHAFTRRSIRSVLRQAASRVCHPNLYNLPQEDDYRSCFEAAPSHNMVCQDCSGQELRIAADYSGEPEWLNAFNNDQDVHCISSDDLFPDLWREYAVLNPTVMTVKGKGVLIPACAYFTQNLKKCECPKHNELRSR